ncbi:MAG: hypothetical protein PVS2B3_13230 [Steroidobacteraceae bacterium]
MKPSTQFAATLAWAALAAAPGTLSAQTARSGGGASAQLAQQLQQLASERTSLQAENERLKKELGISESTVPGANLRPTFALLPVVGPSAGGITLRMSF